MTDPEQLADAALETELGRILVGALARQGTADNPDDREREASAWVRERTLWAARWLIATVENYRLELVIDADLVAVVAGPKVVAWGPSVPEPPLR